MNGIPNPHIPVISALRKVRQSWEVELLENTEAGGDMLKTALVLHDVAQAGQLNADEERAALGDRLYGDLLGFLG